MTTRRVEKNYGRAFNIHSKIHGKECPIDGRISNTKPPGLFEFFPPVQSHFNTRREKSFFLCRRYRSYPEHYVYSANAAHFLAEINALDYQGKLKQNSSFGHVVVDLYILQYY